MSTKVKNTLYILYSLDMNLYVQQRSFVIIQYVSTKVKKTFYKQHGLDKKHASYIIFILKSMKQKNVQSRHKFVCTTKIIES